MIYITFKEPNHLLIYNDYTEKLHNTKDKNNKIGDL